MAVDTKHVTGRRTLAFQTLDEVLADAERCVRENYQALGNWSAGQIFSHLARTMNGSIDGMKFSAPWYVRWIMPLFKKKFLQGPMPAGFQLPANAREALVPQESVAAEQGLAELRAAIQRLKTTESRAPSPVFGRLTREESDQLNRGHAAMHLSFLVPQ